MSVALTPAANTLHATVTGPAPLDDANGTEIGATMGQQLLDNAQYAVDRLGAYRIHQLFEGGTGGGADGQATSIFNTTTAPWVNVPGETAALPSLVAGDIVVASYFAMLSIFDSGGGGPSVQASLRCGFSTLEVPGLADPWISLSSSLIDGSVVPVLLKTRGVIVSPGSYDIQMQAGVTIGAGLTMQVWSPTSLQVTVYRSNA